MFPGGYEIFGIYQETKELFGRGWSGKVGQKMKGKECKDDWVTMI